MTIFRLNQDTFNFTKLFEEGLIGQSSSDFVHEKINFGDELDHMHIVYNEKEVFASSPLLFIINDNIEQQFEIKRYAQLLKRGFILCFYNKQCSFTSNILEDSDKILAGLKYLKNRQIGNNYYIFSEGRYSGLIAMHLVNNNLFKFSIVKNPI